MVFEGVVELCVLGGKGSEKRKEKRTGSFAAVSGV